MQNSTPGYLYSMAAALVGLPCIGTGLGGALIGRARGDPIDAMDSYTVAAFLFMFAVAFAMRLIFWPSAPAGMRRTVRLLITAIFAIEIPLALLAFVEAISLPHSTKHGAIAVTFSVFAVLCQVGSVMWLLMYRPQEL